MIWYPTNEAVESTCNVVPIATGISDEARELIVVIGAGEDRQSAVVIGDPNGYLPRILTC